MATSRILLSDWGRGRPETVDLFPPGPCPVCGTAQGSCTHDIGKSVSAVRTAQRNVEQRIRGMAKKDEENQGGYQQAEPEGTVIPADKDQGFTDLAAGAASVDDLVVLQEDVYQEYYQEGSKRPSYRLVAAAGTAVSKAHLSNLGAKVGTSKQEDTAVHESGAGTPGQTDALNPTQEDKGSKKK